MPAAPDATDAGSDVQKLARVLGLLDVVSFGLGNCLGAGIYVTVGAALVNCAGPAVCLSFLIGGVSALLTALCYAELASQPELAKVCGSAYTYTSVTLGRFAGTLTGWYLSIGYILGAAAVARGWAHYVEAMFDAWVGPQTYLGMLLFEDHPIPGPLSDVLSIELSAPLLCAFLTCVVLSGTRESAKFNTVLTALNVLVIIAFVIGGLAYFDARNLVPFAKAPNGDGGLGGIVAGAGLVYFAFIGYDAVTALAAEVEDPARTIPRAVVLTVLSVTAVYTLCALTLAGMVPAGQVSTEAPLMAALSQKGAHGLAIIVGCGALLTSAANAFCALLGQPRIWFAMARDGLIPKQFMYVNPATKVPQTAALFAGACCAVLSGTLQMESLVKVTSAASLVVFNFVAMGLCRRQLAQRLPAEACSDVVNCARSCVLMAHPIACLALGWALKYHPYSGSVFIALGAACLAVATAVVLWNSHRPQSPVAQACWATEAQESDSGHEAFALPYGPVVPMLAVAVNSVLLGSLGMAVLRQLWLWTIPVLLFCALQRRKADASEQSWLIHGQSPI